MNSLLKSGNALLATFVAVTALPSLAAQTPTAPAPQSQAPQTQASPATQAPAPQTPANTAPSSPSGSTQSPATSASAEPVASAPAAPMSPVDVELVSKLDTKTAKTGDNLEARTRAEAKTADGTAIPKGSKLTGHVVAVQPSSAGTNSQVVVAFDQLELKGGQSMPVHSEIESIGAGAESTPADSASASGAPRPTPSVASPAAGGGMNGARGTASAPAPTDPASGSAPSGAPPAGTVVAKNGGIAIQTTSMPGILLANNAPGQQDPRMAKASSILLGAKRDVQLDGGTKMVMGIATAGAGR